jgi:GNAT superfamily N-acetyltransferase
VAAIGICATSGCVFRECYNVMGGVDTVLPVDVYVPGCAARPESIIDGILLAVDLLEKKRVYMKSMHGRMKDMIIGRAVTADAPEILALQKIVYQNEAEMYDDWSLAPLKQTLEEMRKDFETHIFIKAVVGGKIIGSVRGTMDAGTARLSRLIVHPYFWKQGIGTRLVQEAEDNFPRAARFETFTGQKSRHTMEPYQRLGYVPVRQEKVSEQRDRVYFARNREGA